MTATTLKTADSVSSATRKIIERHDAFMVPNLSRFPIAMVKGHGCEVEDADGKDYLDLFAGFGGPVLGHCHPDQIAAVTKQANKLWHVGNTFHTDPQTRLAEAIFKHGFGGQSYFCHSGADANEAAFKLARLYGEGKRHKIISASASFHGRSFAAMMATGQPKVREGFEPWIEGFTHVPFNDIDALRRAVDDSTVAIILEPIQGEGGVNVPGDDYLPAVRALCDERDVLLICDEVWTGVGRTGKWFAYQHWDVQPDIMTLAKGVGGGLPVGVMCAKPDVAAYFDPRKQGVVKHATTLGGNCLSMAVSAAIFETIERDGLLDHAKDVGDYAMEQLRLLARNLPMIRDVRGKGLFIGVELNLADENCTFKDVRNIVEAAMARGLLINGTQGNVIRLAPALVVTREQIDQGLTTLAAILRGDEEA